MLYKVYNDQPEVSTATKTLILVILYNVYNITEWGARMGGSLVVWTIEDARRLVPPCWSVAYMQPPAQAGTPRGSTARRAVSFLNQNFEVELADVIALIVNYLGVPFGMGFTK